MTEVIKIRMKSKIMLLVLVVGMFLISFVSATLTDGLTTYYTFEESSGNLIDSLGTYNFTNQYTVYDYPGKIDNSYFYNTSGYSYYNGNFIGYNSFSISGWIYANGSIGDLNIFSGRYTSSGNPIIQLATTSSTRKLFFRLRSNSGTGITMLQSSSALSPGQWYFFVATFNATTGNQSLYLNDESPTTLTYSGGNFSNNNRLSIGSDAYDLGSKWNGSIDELAIWTNVVLNQTQVLELYNSGNGLTYPFEAEAPTGGQINSSSISQNSSSTYPKFYDMILHSVQWMTNATALSSYIFSWNNSGIWENLSTTLISGISNWSNVTLNITAVKNSNIGWYIWANDSEGKINVTAVQQYLVRNSNPYGSNPLFNVSTTYNGTPVKVNATIGDLDGLDDISEVIATIYKNTSSGSDTGLNTTPLNYTYPVYNPILPADTFGGLETSTIYEMD